jgi:hypothetical protein
MFCLQSCKQKNCGCKVHAPTPLVGVMNPNDADVPTDPMEEVMLLALHPMNT